MRFCLHKWSRWSKAIKDYNGNWRQVCACEKCGAITQRKAIGVMSAHISSDVNEAIKAVEEKN